MTCIRKLAAALNGDDCASAPVGGMLDNITLINKADYDLATVTYKTTDNMVIEALVKAVGKDAYTFSFVPETTNATATRAGINMYDHSIVGNINASSNAIRKALMDMDGGRYVAIVENMNPVAEMKFQVYGVDSGLTMTALTVDTNANSGVVALTLASSANSKERTIAKSLFKTDLTVTRAIITTLTTVVP